MLEVHFLEKAKNIYILSSCKFTQVAPFINKNQTNIEEDTHAKDVEHCCTNIEQKVSMLLFSVPSI